MYQSHSAGGREAARERELRGEHIRQLRQIRRELAGCLARGEADSAHEKLKAYYTICAPCWTEVFREYCVRLYCQLSEELAASDEGLSRYQQQLRPEEKTVFQAISEAGSSQEAADWLSWYVDQLLAWYRPLQEDTGYRVTVFVEAYIEAHYMDPVSIEEIARQVGFSTNYVRSIFKNNRRITIQNYLSAYRLNMACRLLRDTPATVSRVGQLVGYNNVSYFCAAFQKRFGKTPSEWRGAPAQKWPEPAAGISYK